MVTVLLDTCVVSELQRPQPNLRVLEAVEVVAHGRSYLSAITMGELYKGVHLLPDSTRRRNLQAWTVGLEQRFAERILALDLETARIWGEISARARIAGHPIGVPDALIAATAIRHGLHVMTRNVKDFEPTGVLTINPWEGSES